LKTDAYKLFEDTCKTASSLLYFGLCDDPPPATRPAYIKEVENEPSHWIATVLNEGEKEVVFYAIDHCIAIFRSNGDPESRCDGMLQCERKLAFVELKDRASSGWLKKGSDQLTTTINIFTANHDITVYNKIEAYVANKQRPLSNTGNATQIQKFKDDTGLILKVQAHISV
jgi:hypothetical protein